MSDEQQKIIPAPKKQPVLCGTGVGLLAPKTVVALDLLKDFLAAHSGSSLSYAARECGVSKALAQSLVCRGYLPAPWPQGQPRNPETKLVLSLLQRGAELREPLGSGPMPPLTLADIATYPPRGPTEAEARAELERLRAGGTTKPTAKTPKTPKTPTKPTAKKRGRPRKADQSTNADDGPGSNAAAAGGSGPPRELPDKTPWDSDSDNPEISELRRHIKIMMTRNMGNAGAIAKYAAALKSLVGVREDEQGHEIETGNKATIYVPGQDRGIEDE